MKSSRQAITLVNREGEKSRDAQWEHPRSNQRSATGPGSEALAAAECQMDAPTGGAWMKRRTDSGKAQRGVNPALVKRNKSAGYRAGVRTADRGHRTRAAERCCPHDWVGQKEWSWMTAPVQVGQKWALGVDTQRHASVQWSAADSHAPTPKAMGFARG